MKVILLTVAVVLACWYVYDVWLAALIAETPRHVWELAGWTWAGWAGWQVFLRASR